METTADPTSMQSAASPSPVAAPGQLSDARLRELVIALRSILGPSDPELSDDQLLGLLQAAKGDPDKALDLYFQAKAKSDAEKRGDTGGAGEQGGGEENVMTMAMHAEVGAEDHVDDPEQVDKGVGAEGEAAPLALDGNATEKKSGKEIADNHGAIVKDGKTEAEWTQQATDLNELLGGNVDRAVIIALLQRTNNSIQRAVEVFFAEQSALPPNTGPTESVPSVQQIHASTNAVDSSEVHPLPHPSLEPLMPPAPASLSSSESSASSPSSETQQLSPPAATYEVTMDKQNFGWQVGNVFGRAVVQWIEPGGPAATAGIHKSDVLLSIREKVVTEQNCSAIVQELLASETIQVPANMRLRRAPEQHPPVIHVQLPPNSGRSTVVGALNTPNVESAATAVANLVEPDGDVVMSSANGDTDQGQQKYGKFGFQALCNAVDAMSDAIAGTTCEKKVLVDLLLRAEFNLDLAVNTFFSETRVASDFRHVVGFDWDPANPTKCMNVEPYHATIPAGPLGLTVENILERTIVVDIKPGGAAEQAAVKRSSWLVALNGNPISHLTHKETLRMIETVPRPLELELVVVPQEEYRHLRKQLTMNVRQNKNERPVPEQDRMSFRVFQLKIHQAVLMMPKLIIVALFQHVTSEKLAAATGSSARDPFDSLLLSHAEADTVLQKEVRGEDDDSKEAMCEERRFLLNLFASIHEYDDKGESIVIRTIQFMGWLAKRCLMILRWVEDDERSTVEAQFPDGDTEVNVGSSVQTSRRWFPYELLLHLVTHVLESLSIIENHATWDVMVDAFKLIIGELSDCKLDETMTPMIARLSVSPSPTARILPIALLALIYPRVSIDVRVQLRGMLDRMGNDDNPLVRRAIASIIGDLVLTAGATSAQWGVQLLEKATSDSHDIVRIFAVKSCMRMAQELRQVLRAAPDMTPDSRKQTLHLLFCQMVPMVNTYTSDTSWQVRLEAAKSLPAFCRAFGLDYTDVIVDHFVGLVRDPTVEIRRACAEAVFELGRVLIQLARQRSLNVTKSAELSCAMVDVVDASSSVEVVAAGVKHIDLEDQDDITAELESNRAPNEFVMAAQTKIVRSVLPVTYGLSTDLSVAVRLALAKSVGQALQLLMPGSYDDLAPIFTQMLDDSQDANVRASLVEEMARYCDPTSPVLAPLLAPAIQSLRMSTQWRIRVKFVECIAAWAARNDGIAVPLEFADATLEMLSDAVHEVRAVACQTLPSLVRSVGPEWLTSKALPKILQCLGSTFNARVTGLIAIEALSSELLGVGKLQEVIESVVDECTSKVPNLRFRALRSLTYLLPLLGDATVTETTLEFIRPLAAIETEVDPDVRDTATMTIASLEKYLVSKRSIDSVEMLDSSIKSADESSGNDGSPDINISAV